MTSVHCRSAILFSLLLLRAQVGSADASLDGFEKPTRVLNQYIVVLKDDPQWKHKLEEPRKFQSSAEEDDYRKRRSDDLASDYKAVAKVAEELAKKYHGTLISHYGAALKGFSVQMSEADAREMAKDLRVASISADEPIGISAGPVISNTVGVHVPTAKCCR